MIKAAVFDMDGLMFDSERLVYEIWQEMMDEKGYDYNVVIFKNTIGLRSDVTEEYYSNLYGKDFDYKTLKQRSRETFIQRVEKNGVPIKKGLLQLLEFLKKEGIKTAVATSTSAQTALKILRLANVYNYIDAFVCGDDVKNSKPHPEIFITAAKKLDTPCESCVAFEDSINGIKSAFAANMKAVMVPDFLKPTEEIRPMLSFLCKSLDEAIEFVRQNLR